MSQNKPAFVFPVRVYWEDTDAGGIVFYANYLKFFERARTEWIRSKGISQESMRHQGGPIFIVTETSVQYRSPARLDDLIDVSVDVAQIRPASMLLTQVASRGDTILATGSIRIGCVDSKTLTPCRIPSQLIHSIE